MCCVITKNTGAVCSNVRHVMHSHMYTLILLGKKRVHLFIYFYLFFLYFCWGGTLRRKRSASSDNLLGSLTLKISASSDTLFGGGAPKMISSAALDMLLEARCDSETEELLS